MRNFSFTQVLCDVYSKLIHISSTSVYGISSKLVGENLSEKFLKPQSPYADIKLKEEKMLISEYKGSKVLKSKIKVKNTKDVGETRIYTKYKTYTLPY